MARPTGRPRPTLRWPAGYKTIYDRLRGLEKVIADRRERAAAPERVRLDQASYLLEQVELKLRASRRDGEAFERTASAGVPR